MKGCEIVTEVIKVEREICVSVRLSQVIKHLT